MSEEKNENLFDRDFYEHARHFSRFNRAALEQDNLCGCYYCGKIFAPSEIEEWCCEEADGEEVTALCPHCGIDSVISESSGHSITQEFLEAMHCSAFE
jgi:hypothetical protein